MECLLVKDIGNASSWNSPPGPPTMSRDPIMKNFMGAMQWDREVGVQTGRREVLAGC